MWHLASGEMTSYEGAASPARGGTEPGPAIDRGRTLPAGDGRRLRVLLLDGQDLVHWGFKTLLAAEHWVERFVAAHSADEAIELARRHAPHVAVVDLAAATGSVGELYARLRTASPGTRMLHMSSGERIFCSHEGDAGRACSTRLLWMRVQGGVIKALQGTTLAELVEFGVRHEREPDTVTA